MRKFPHHGLRNRGSVVDPRRPALDQLVNIVIITYDEDIDVVEPTAIGALAVRGRARIYLCDDSRRPEMLAKAGRYGIDCVKRADNTHAEVGNINAVLPRLAGDLVQSGRHEQSLFFDILLLGRNRLHSVFCFGSAAIIRLSAVRKVGGITTTTSTEDFEISLLWQEAS